MNFYSMIGKIWFFNRSNTIVPILILIGLFFVNVLMASEGEEIIFRTDVFVGGENGYHTYRIPTIVETNQGTLLAFCEARKNSHHDTGDIDLILKRSFDNGRTWSEKILVYEEGGDASITIGNPVPIIENKSNKIHLFFTRNYRQIFHTTSIDEGKTWSTPKEFTDILKGFNYPRVLIATGPVHGIQMNSGRLIVPVWLCDRTRKERYQEVTLDRMRSGIIFSDDLGKSWKTGGLVPANLAILHEATVVERKDGTLLLNMRVYDEFYRAESISKDGGLTWSDPYLNKSLPDPTCQGSLLKTSDNHLLFLNPAVKSKGGKGSRKNLMLKISKDDGNTWNEFVIINKGASGYSDMVETKNETILCIYENGIKYYAEKISIAIVSK